MCIPSAEYPAPFSQPQRTLTAHALSLTNATQRILTALVGAPLVIGLVYVGGVPFVVLVLVASLLAQRELYGLFVAGGAKPYQWAGLLLGALLVGRVLWPALLVVALVIAVLMFVALPFERDETPHHNIAATLFGVFYPTTLFSFLAELRLARGETVGNDEAFWLTLAVFLLIWSADSFAYYAGRAFGKHPLAPRVSPKKTWEGAVGGAAGAVLVGVVLKLTALSFLAWPHVIVLALLGGCFSPLGDLAESRLKRAVGIKDSGTILPGHGGLLDRFDALILTVPLVYLYLAYVAQLFG